MQLIPFILLITVLFPATSLHAQTPKFKQLNFFDGGITLEVPSDFTPMDSELRKYKYPTKSPESAFIYANTAGDLNLVVELTAARCSGTGEELVAIEGVLVKQLEAVPEVKVVQHRSGSINDLNLVAVESETTTAHGEKLTTILLGFSYKGRMCFVVFTGPTASMQQWEPLHSHLLDTLIIKE